MKEKVVIFRETQCSHALGIWFVSTAPMESAVSVTKLPLKWQFLSSRIRRSPTGAIGITYALTSPPLYSNILARGGSLFLKSCLCNN